ncbi:MAG: type II secretion system protein [Candidatus Gracilibacteria bacterium]|nr:type II secretion system protein [Candidatus Gracilibacteria bacterium]
MKNIKNKAFTLVELIVVITILAILGTIAFISLQGYSAGARDSKRLSDVTNILKKIGVEETQGTLVLTLISNQTTSTGKINNQDTSIIQGVPNYTNLEEDGNNFKDPSTDGDYVLGFAKGGTGTGAYKFIQIATLSEERNQAVLKGNYYLLDVANDSPSLVKDGSGTFVTDGGTNVPYSL